MFDAVETAVLASIADGTAFASAVVVAALGLYLGIKIVKKVANKAV